MQTVLSGTLTHYHDLHSDSSPVILLLHGWGQNSSHWLPLVDRLDPRFRYFLLDLPGFGSTASLPGTPSLPEYAAFVLDFIAKKQLKSVILFGHSFGGQLAVYLAANHPEMFSHLILLSPSAVRRTGMPVRLKSSLLHSLKSLFIFFPSILRRPLYRLLVSSDYAATSSANRQVFTRIIKEDLTSLLPQIPHPVYILWGDNDTAIPNTSRLIASLVPDAYLYVLYNSDHNPHLTNPDALVAILNHLLEKIHVSAS